MPGTRQLLGRLGEAAAARHLVQSGWEILERNYRCHSGEVDLIARLQDTVAFVEVRTRASESYGTPEESITPSKARRMVRCALTYIGSHPDPRLAWRIDVIAVRVRQGRVVHLEQYPNAVEP
jgi:putative endonuclease